MTMRMAIIGLGAAARNIHIPACEAVPDIELVAALEPNTEPGEFGFPVYRNAEHMFRDVSPDAVIIATPTSSHHALSIDMLQRGCHVICEKPFTETLEQAFHVVETAERLGLSVVVNNEFRFMECHLAAEREISGPRFGDLRFIQMDQTFFTTEETEKGWRGTDPRRTCKEFGTHVFDLCRFFYGDDPLWISARMPSPGGTGGPDYLNLIDLEFSDQRYARITLDRLSRGRHRYLDIRLDGTNACIETSLGGNLSLEAGINPRTRRPYAGFDLSWGGSAHLWRGESGTKIASDPRALFANATANLLRDWLGALKEGREACCSGRTVIVTLATMLAAYESAKSGGPVDLSEFMDEARNAAAEESRRSVQ